MAPQLTIDGRELELSSPAAPAAAPAEGLFALEAFAQLSGQRALELEELEPRTIPRDAERAAQGLGPYIAPAGTPESESEPESEPQSTPRRCSPADPAHRARMDAGRARAQLERDARAVERVEAFREWSRAGAPLGSIPAVPSDADWRTAREHGSSAA